MATQGPLVSTVRLPLWLSQVHVNLSCDPDGLDASLAGCDPTVAATCDRNAHCINIELDPLLNPRYACKCFTGYLGDGTTCEGLHACVIVLRYLNIFSISFSSPPDQTTTSACVVPASLRPLPRRRAPTCPASTGATAPPATRATLTRIAPVSLC